MKHYMLGFALACWGVLLVLVFFGLPHMAIRHIFWIRFDAACIEASSRAVASIPIHHTM